MEDMIGDFPAAEVSIEHAGPPTFVGQRIIVNGNPAGFRMLAALLNHMAQRVENPDLPEHAGWHFMINSEVVPQLRMDQDTYLSLNCEP